MLKTKIVYLFFNWIYIADVEFIKATRSVISYLLLYFPPKWQIHRDVTQNRKIKKLENQPETVSHITITISILNHKIPKLPTLSFLFSPQKTQETNNDLQLSLSRKKKKRMSSKMMAFTLTSPRFFSAVSRKPTTRLSPSRTHCAHFSSHGRSISLRRRLFLLPVKATTDQSGLEFFVRLLIKFQFFWCKSWRFPFFQCRIGFFVWEQNWCE